MTSFFSCSFYKLFFTKLLVICFVFLFSACNLKYAFSCAKLQVLYQHQGGFVRMLLGIRLQGNTCHNGHASTLLFVCEQNCLL